jgi:2-aminoadipate transaminase
MKCCANESLLAVRTAGMGVNAIREILKVVAQPGMISLAGGIPAPESFPIEILGRLTEKVLATYGASALQYDPTEGFGPLREALVEHLARMGVRTTSGEVLVASGSQGVLDALGMVLITKADRVAVEAPTYLGALQAFRPYEPIFVPLETDEQGLIPEYLESVLRSGPIKFIYLVPTFQNPTGRTIPLHRRVQIAAIIQKYNALLVEDDPYSALRYTGEPVAPIYSLAPENVVYVSTLSKVFAPGLRIGFCLAPETIRRWLVVAKQGIDLHTSTFNQALAAEYISGGYLAAHLPNIIELYRPRQEAMLQALDHHFPASMKWSRPQGGMFFWVQGPHGMNMVSIYHQAAARKVAFVPGTYFYAHEGQGIETMRLNFTMADTNTLGLAIERLAGVLKESLTSLAD